jgi:hypothetical protein
LKFLVYEPFKLGIPSDYYSLIKQIPIRPNQNKLQRNLIPFYRSHFYSLKSQDLYREKIKRIINNI